VKRVPPEGGTRRLVWIGRPRAGLDRLAEAYSFSLAPERAGREELLSGGRPDALILDLTTARPDDAKWISGLAKVLGDAAMIGLVSPDRPLLPELIRAGLHDFVLAPLRIEELEARLYLALRAKTEARAQRRVMGHLAEMRIRFDLPTDLSLIAPITETLSLDLLARGRASEEQVNQLRLIISEVLTNAMEHGSLEIGLEEKLAALESDGYEALLRKRLADPRLSGRRVKVSRELKPERVCYEVQDEGLGFNLEATMARLADPDPTKPCGRGLFLLRHFVDEYRAELGGRRLILIKRLGAVSA